MPLQHHEGFKVSQAQANLYVKLSGDIGVMTMVSHCTFVGLGSRPPLTGVLYGESPKVLRRELSESFLGLPNTLGVLPAVPGNWECPRAESTFPSFFNKERTLGSTPSGTFGNTPRHTFWESPKSTPKALAGALSGIPHKALL